MASAGSHPDTCCFPTLDSTINSLLQVSLAPSSQAHYARELHRFQGYCLSVFHEQHWFPVSNSSMAELIAHLFYSKYATATNQSSFYCLSFFHKVLGQPDLTHSFFRNKLRQDAHKSRPSFDLRSPITLDMLQKLVIATPSVAPDVYTDIMLRAMFSLAFFALLHVTEMTVRRGSTQHVLSFGNVTVSRKKVEVTFDSYKHSMGRPFTLAIPPMGRPACPLALLQEYFEVHGHEPGPLFMCPGGTPVSTSFSNDQLQAVLSLAGLADYHVSSHSFRIGWTSHLAQLGVLELKIKLMGHWGSDAYMHYTRVMSIMV